MQLSYIVLSVISTNHLNVSNGSMQNGTVRKAEMSGAMIYRLYLCSAFETQVQDIEY